MLICEITDCISWLVLVYASVPVLCALLSSMRVMNPLAKRWLAIHSKEPVPARISLICGLHLFTVWNSGLRDDIGHTYLWIGIRATASIKTTNYIASLFVETLPHQVSLLLSQARPQYCSLTPRPQYSNLIPRPLTMPACDHLCTVGAQKCAASNQMCDSTMYKH